MLARLEDARGQMLRRKKGAFILQAPELSGFQAEGRLLRLARSDVWLAEEKCLADRNIERKDGGSVSEVGERYFCKHR